MEIKVVRKQFIAYQAIVLCIMILSAFVFDLSESSTFIFLTSVWNIVSYATYFYVEMKYAPDFHPLQILALICIVFVGINSFDIFLQMLANKQHFFGIYRIDTVMYKGMIGLGLQHLLIFAIFLLGENRYNKEEHVTIADKIIYSPNNYFLWAKISYVAIWFFRIISYFIPLASLSSVLGNIISTGHLLTLFFILFEMVRKPNDNSLKFIHWGIVALEISMVLGSGMKEDILRNFIPYIIYLLIIYKGKVQRINIHMLVSLGAIILFTTYFVFPYVSILRTIAERDKIEWREINTNIVFEEYNKYISLNDAQDDKEFSDRSINYMINRSGSVGCNSWAIDYEQNNGTNEQYFIYNATSLIPRAIWPNKPTFYPGIVIYQLVSGDTNWMDTMLLEGNECSISLGFVGSCFFCFGYFGILFIVANSFFIWFVWHFCRDRMLYHPIALWCFISLIIVIIKDFEAFQDCGINFFVTTSLYLLIIRYVYKAESLKIEEMEYIND